MWFASRPGLRLAGGCRPKPTRIDPAALTDPSNWPKLLAILSAAPQIPWDGSPDAHAALLVGYLQKELSGAFGVVRGKPRQAYLSVQTWELHGQVAALRKRCARRRKQCCTHLLAAAFGAWATRDAEVLHSALDSPWAVAGRSVRRGLGRSPFELAVARGRLITSRPQRCVSCNGDDKEP